MKSWLKTRYLLASLAALGVIALVYFAPVGSTAARVQSTQTSAAPPSDGSVQPSPLAARALAALSSAAGGQVVAHVSRETGVYDFVRATGSNVLASGGVALASPESRARAFLGQHGGVLGMTEAERNLVASGGANANSTAASALSFARVVPDPSAPGASHVKFDQTYKGLKVFGGQVVVHLNAQGVTAVNGNFVPNIAVSTTPKVTAARAGEIAKSAVAKSPGQSLSVASSSLAIYHKGLLEGYKGRSVLAYAVEVAGPQSQRDQVWVDAQTGDVLNTVSLRHDALNRIVYSPTYDPANPNMNVVKREGDLSPPPPANVAPTENLYRFTGQSYNIFASAFGRDSYNALGITMRTVLLANDQCPNAYWDGSATNYCPDFDKDDIVAHEWGHAYTQFTHDLIYSYQSGALNESYSDIFGETIDLNNNEDGKGGTNNAQPTTYTVQNGQYVPTGGGVRWRVGEDVQGLSEPAALGILRDMAFPEAFGDPGKVSSDVYQCDASDGGGVHTNSGVPNHAFTLLVDGGNYNGVAVQSIGFNRALQIYYRAMTVYQTSSTDFAQHEQALQASCQDLVGLPLKNFTTDAAIGTPSTDLITAGTCQQVTNAMAAVEMSVPATNKCNFQKLLDPQTPAVCDGATDIFRADFESGLAGWTLDNEGVTADWPDTDWQARSELPANPDGSPRAGTAAFAVNPRIGEPNGGTCQPGGDVSGQFWMDSPEITVPASASDLKLSFEHFVQTEVGFDGGNVKISVNGRQFTLVPQSAYVFNRPNVALSSAADGNTNPKAGEFAWHGANEGELSGSWGTTVINLADLTNPGDKVRVRFDFGQDGCNGNLGWLVDNVRLYSCPVLEAPTLSLGPDYGNPDRDARFTLNWQRPAGAVGPDLVQESTSCGPVFTDDAQETLVAGANSKWAGSEQWTSQPNPNGGSTAYYIADGALQDESLTMKGAVAIPAGAGAALTFTTRQGFEDTYDFGKVEVSTDNGASFVEVASYTGPEGLTPADVFEGTRTIDLSRFAGQAVKVRFRVTSDLFNVGAPAGWYVDNISITASNFQTVASGLAGTSYTFTGKADGNYCYRVGTTYDVAGVPAASPLSNVVNVTVSKAACLTNVAAAVNGALTSASSTYSSRNYSTAGATDGDRTGRNWESGGGWNDSTRGAYPDALEIAFPAARTLNEVRVYTLQNNYKAGVEPTAATMADVYGIIDFDVQYWDGAQWVTLPGGAIRGNNRALRSVPVADVSTTKLRVLVLNSRANFSRVVEVEAFGCTAP